MSQEFNSTQNAERLEPQSTRRAIEQIESYIKNAALDSPMFQAFADYTDRLEAEERLHNYSNDKGVRIALSLIDETIRQRKNGLAGYRRAYEFHMMHLHADLRRALIAGKQTTAPKVRSTIQRYLMDIKEQAIEKQSLQLGQYIRAGIMSALKNFRVLRQPIETLLTHMRTMFWQHLVRKPTFCQPSICMMRVAVAYSPDLQRFLIPILER